MDKPIGEHETKFVFANNRSQILIAWLRLRCQPDWKYPVGKISSIYFDSLDWRLLQEKIDSDFFKTKVRLRWYSDAKSGNKLPATFLEIKNKIGSSRKKKRIQTTSTSDWISSLPLHDPQLLKISAMAREYTGNLYGHLHPAFQIDYQRYRFVDSVSGARLSVDFNIHVPKSNARMLSQSNTTCLKSGVFELKGNNDSLPDWLHQLTALGCKKESFSKYGSCYAHLKQIIY